MNIQELQENLLKRNNPRWYKKGFKIKEYPKEHKQEWKELYQDFNSAIKRDNT